MIELHVTFNHVEAREMLTLINRALNTLDPKKWPPFASKLEDALATFLANSRFQNDEV